MGCAHRVSRVFVRAWARSRRRHQGIRPSAGPNPALPRIWAAERMFRPNAATKLYTILCRIAGLALAGRPIQVRRRSERWKPSQSELLPVALPWPDRPTSSTRGQTDDHACVRSRRRMLRRRAADGPGRSAGLTHRADAEGVSTPEENPATCRSKSLPREDFWGWGLECASRPGSSALQIAGGCQGALARRAKPCVGIR